ncbi:ring-cleaving dioxygenase [Salimicrobium halophilum]|uniref:Glyoxalase family protein n=1 Tax=Salimicrobium halophilum TaxID=86666 RepID=A0A1G8UFD2_9BACI|nr:ring-cleaving dioxygenase [Salimicrobium halophilum]SDJ52513.1 glyoxalase family protein [Salimicrobium halophilum]
MNGIKGVHHVTAITSSAEKNYEFFTYILGMRLVKKTVNQDDIKTYHLFFADDEGNPGTDMTFFDFPGIPKGSHGTNEISKTSFRVPSDEALEYWVKRFDHYDISHKGIQERFGKKVLPFTDFDDQAYELVSDEGIDGVPAGVPWQKGPVPNEYGITGLGPLHVRVDNIEYFKEMMEKVLEFTEIDKDGAFHLFEVGEGGNGAQVIVEFNNILPPARQGYGTVHHAAFRVEDRDALEHWIDRMPKFGFRTSGYVNRFYFQSLYVQVAPQILFEFATDGPGFMDDEPYETLGENLALPPMLEPKRNQIEDMVRSIDTVRSTKDIKKEYFN